jgi:hypothetical protein
MTEKKQESQSALLGCLLPLIVIVLIIKLGLWFFDSDTLLTKRDIIRDCQENERFILGHYAPDDLEMWDDNPHNDPSWNEPSISLDVDEVTKVGKGTLEIQLSTSVYGDDWEVSCTYEREKLEYQFKNEDIEIVND